MDENVRRDLDQFRAEFMAMRDALYAPERPVTLRRTSWWERLKKYWIQRRYGRAHRKLLANGRR